MGTVTYIGTGTGDNGTDNVDPTYRTGIADGNLSILAISSGSSANNVPETVAGWTFLASGSGGAGSFGVDSGDRRASAWWQENDGTETGNFNVDITAGDTARAQIHQLSKDSGTWDLAAVGGSDDDDANNSYEVVFPAMEIAAGDVLLILWTLANNAITESSESFTATGLTFGTITTGASTNVGTGSDHRHETRIVPVTAGSGTVAVTYSATLGAASAGGAVLVRIRAAEASPNEGTGDLPVDIALDATGSRPSQGVGDVPIDVAVAATGSRDSQGTADLGIGIAVAATGSRDSQGTAGLGIDIAYTATGARPSQGTADLPLEVDLAATGDTASEGVGDVAVDVAFAATGARPSEGTAVLAVTVAYAATGNAPTGNAEGTAALGIDVAYTATGARDSQGQAALPVTITYSATGSAPALTPNDGTADLPLEIDYTATGARPSQATAALAIDIAYTATGNAPTATPTGTADLPVTLTYTATGTAPAQGQADLPVSLAYAAQSVPPPLDIPHAARIIERQHQATTERQHTARLTT